VTGILCRVTVPKGGGGFPTDCSRYSIQIGSTEYRVQSTVLFDSSIKALFMFSVPELRYRYNSDTFSAVILLNNHLVW
jgi:hypothetical protein